MKIKIDNDKCLRCGMCTGICMEVFDFDDEGNIKVDEDSIDNNIEFVTVRWIFINIFPYIILISLSIIGIILIIKTRKKMMIS